jgi:hypothetical protein
MSENCGILEAGTLSDERIGLYFTRTVAFGPSQSSRSQSAELTTLFYCLETLPTWRARSLYLYPPESGWPSYTPGIAFPFVAS